MSGVCGFLGCKNPLPADAYPWAMCDECYLDALDVEDSELE